MANDAPAGAATETSAVPHKKREQAVLDTATAVIAEKGYAATTIQDIADRLGMLKGSLYYYVPSKEDLLHRLLSASHDEADRIRDEVGALDLDPAAELQEFLRRMSLWFLANPQRAEIFFSESRHLTAERADELHGRGLRFAEHIQQLIVAARSSGRLGSGIDTRVLSRFVLGSLNSIRTWPTSRARSASGRSANAEELADAFVELIGGALGLSNGA
jgi:TetR/AcrR family transcriptional regulator, cholesterol catabolism regulator